VTIQDLIDAVVASPTDETRTALAKALHREGAVAEVAEALASVTVLSPSGGGRYKVVTFPLASSVPVNGVEAARRRIAAALDEAVKVGGE
jgi:hypothetical protein